MTSGWPVRLSAAVAPLAKPLPAMSRETVPPSPPRRQGSHNGERPAPLEGADVAARAQGPKSAADRSPRKPPPRRPPRAPGFPPRSPDDPSARACVGVGPPFFVRAPRVGVPARETLPVLSPDDVTVDDVLDQAAAHGGQGAVAAGEGQAVRAHPGGGDVARPRSCSS